MATTTNQNITDGNWTLITLTGTSMVVAPLYGDNKTIEWSATNPPVGGDDRGVILPKSGGKFDYNVYVRSTVFPYDISVTQ